MSQVRPAFAEDFPSIYPLFSAFQAPRPPEEAFRRLFVRRWGSPHEHCGYLLEDGGRTVGFLGALFSRRPVGQREETFCNMTCWVVDEEPRSEGLLLLGRLLTLKDTTLTNFTANRVAPILRRTGFRDLAPNFKILFPLPLPSAPSSVVFEAERVRAGLDERNRRIFDDHVEFDRSQILLRNGERWCYMTGRRIYKKRMPVFQVHYLSSPADFATCMRTTGLRLCRRLRVAGVLVSEHFLAGVPFWPALTVPQRQAFLFRSKSVQAAEMDLMYSELQVLNL